MANHASTLKRMRTSAQKRLKNRYEHKTTKTFIKKVLTLNPADEKEKEKVTNDLKKAMSMLDKLAKKGIIHPNKSARKKSQLALHVNTKCCQ